MPPPHYLAALPARFCSSRLLKLLFCTGLMALAGCATQPKPTADADTGGTLNHVLRDSYLARTQSDPLGAWLNDGESLDVDVNYSADEGGPTPSQASSRAPKTMVATAMRFLGVKYRFGGDTPKEGFDCSGLVAYAAEKSLGLKLPRSARDQAHEGTSISEHDLRRGDLVFFNTLGRRYSHVGIYLGDHKFVHAPRTGASIRVDDMDMAYWRKRYNGARRLTADAGYAADVGYAATERPAEGRHTKHAATKHARHTTAKRASAKHTAARHTTAKHTAAKHITIKHKTARR